MGHKLAPGRFLAEPQKRYEAASVIMTETVHPAGSRHPRHCHELAYFDLVLQGAHTETARPHDLLCDALTLVFRPPEYTHANHVHDHGVHCFNLELESPWLDRVQGHVAMPRSAIRLDHGTLIQAALRVHREFLMPDAVSPLVIEGLVLDMLGHLVRQGASPERHPPRWLLQVRARLEEEFDQPYTLAELAEQAGVHPVHLARVFRWFFKCTIGEYVRQRRITFACRRLLDSDVSCAQVALAAGFCDQAHFSKTFKRHVGMSPAQFRRRHRGR